MNAKLKERIEKLEAYLIELEYYYDSDIEGFEYEAGAVRDRIAELKAKEV